MQSISLTAGQIKELITIAKNELPNESCAFLLGQSGTVVIVLPLRNVDNSPVRFSIDPRDVLYAYNLAQSKQLDIVGIFHSHPASPFPSRIDREFMEINPVVWLIYSTTKRCLKAFICDDGVKEVAVKIIAAKV